MNIQRLLDGIEDIYPETKPIDQAKPKGIPSAHDPNKMFYPEISHGHWKCDCEHFKKHKTPCRHIYQKRFENVQALWKHITTRVQNNRDIRDANCDDIDEVVTFVCRYREYDVNKLCTLFLNILVLQDQASTDDLHIATNEEFANDKVVGIVIRILKGDGLIELVQYKTTERKIAHSRPIGVYRLTAKGFDFLDARRINEC